MTYVRYIDRTREYYLSEGYTTPYRWAHFDDIPFTPLRAPLSACRIGLVTTGEVAVRGEAPADALARAVYALPTATPVEKLYGRKESYDRHATTLDDVDAYLPLTRLGELAAAGRIRDLAPRFQVVYSNYSQRATTTVDAPTILAQCREDGVGAVFLCAV